MSLYDPRNRKEIFYRGILDGDNSLPDPQTREEIFLKAIAEAMPIITEAEVQQGPGSSATDTISQKGITDLIGYGTRTFAYLANGALFYWTPGNPTTLYFGGALNIRPVGSDTYEFSVAQILTAATAAGLTTGTNSVTSGNRMLMYFDRSDNSIKFGTSIDDNDPTHIVLFRHNYGSVYNGLLVDYYNGWVCTYLSYDKAYAYIDSFKEFSYTMANNSVLTFGDSVIIRPVQGSSTHYILTVSQIITAAAAFGLTVGTNTITTSGTLLMYYDMKAKSVGFQSSLVDTNPGHIILFAHQYASSNTGLLVDYYTRRQAYFFANSNGIFDLPTYWKTYMDTKYPDIVSKDIEVGDHGDSFVFITDCHLEQNQMHSWGAIKGIQENTNVSRVINGGDFVNDKASKTAIYADYQVYANIARKLKMICMLGNHDLNSSWSPPDPITKSDFYALLVKPTENMLVTDGKLYFYQDNANQKLRYIYLDTNAPDTAYIDDDQIDWMKARINELETGWTVIIFAHQFYATDGTFPAYDQNGTKITAALNSIYSTCDATIAGVICGHAHEDYVDSTQSYPIIVVTCDSRNQEGGNDGRPIGTVNEQAFDVIHIDTTAQKFYCTRIGYGSDRTVSY